VHKKTIQLTHERLIGSHHLPAGTRVTLGEKEALDLLKARQAVEVPFDESCKIPAPAKRPYLAIETAEAKPGPRKAARVGEPTPNA
jgi:hypothetical protein